MDTLIRWIGTLGLYAALWVLVFLATYIIKEKFFGKTDDWFSGPIISFIVATAAVVYLFFLNHVSITPL